MGSQKMGEVSLTQETSEDPMSPSHFPVKLAAPSRLPEGRGQPFFFSHLWIGVPRLEESGSSISLLA